MNEESTIKQIRSFFAFSTDSVAEETMGLILNPQYVVDNKHSTKAVMLSIDEWNQVLEELEELEDIRAYDAAKAGPQETVLFEEAVRQIQGDDQE